MDRRVVALPSAGLLLASVVLASACGSTAETSITPNAPSEVRCQPALRSEPASFGSSGGAGTVAVTVSRECTWSATANAPWISFTSGREGQGDGTIGYRVAENGDPVARQGTIAVAGGTVQVGQEPAPCRFTVTVGETSVPADGGQVGVDVRAHTACSWRAASEASWASVSPTSGNGNATVRATIAANTGPARTARVTVAGQAFTIAQGAAPDQPAPTPPPPPAPPPPSPPPVACEYSLTPTSASFDAQGGAGVVRVRTGTACPWVAASTAAWIVVSAPLVGTGTADIRYTVAENFSSSNRTGTILINTEVFRVEQRRAEEIRLEGRVAALSGSCPALRFTAGGRIVTTDQQTEFRSGKCSDLRNGDEVTVHGFRQPDGTVYARRVEIED